MSIFTTTYAGPSRFRLHEGLAVLASPEYPKAWTTFHDCNEVPCGFAIALNNRSRFSKVVETFRHGAGTNGGANAFSDKALGLHLRFDGSVYKHVAEVPPLDHRSNLGDSECRSAGRITMSATDTLSPLHNVLSDTSPGPARLVGTIWQKSWLARVGYEGLLAVAAVLVQWRVTPNTITVTSLAIATFAAGVLTQGWFGLATALLLFAGLLDLLDGAVARLSNQSTRWGALLDASVDRLSDALPLAGLLVLYARSPLATGVIVSCILTGFTISYVRARAESLGVKPKESFMRRAERLTVILFSLILGLFQLEALDAFLGLPYAGTFLALASLLVLNVIGCVSVFNAARQALQADDEARLERESHAESTGIRFANSSGFDRSQAEVSVLGTHHA